MINCRIVTLFYCLIVEILKSLTGLILIMMLWKGLIFRKQKIKSGFFNFKMHFQSSKHAADSKNNFMKFKDWPQYLQLMNQQAVCEPNSFNSLNNAKITILMIIVVTFFYKPLFQSVQGNPIPPSHNFTLIVKKGIPKVYVSFSRHNITVLQFYSSTISNFPKGMLVMINDNKLLQLKTRSLSNHLYSHNIIIIIHFIDVGLTTAVDLRRETKRMD